jgi:hydrogenase maturation protease
MATRTLIIGYGNIDRADDGVAFHVINALRKLLGQPELTDDESGLDDLGEQVDSIFLIQLTPELIDILSLYDKVVFIDAHVFESLDNLHYATVSLEYGTSTFSHHITPGMMLALLKMIHAKEPTGHIISIRGYDFNFHRFLTPETESLIKPAVGMITQVLEK